MRAVGFGHSFVGLRSNNEDRLHIDDSAGLYLVADGMGGHVGGEVAAQLCVDVARRFYERVAAGESDSSGPAPPTDIVEARLDMAFRLAHAEVRRNRTGKLAEMGSTLAAVRIRDGRAYIAHLGDSRVYRLRAGELECITRDHSLVEEVGAAGLRSLPNAHLLAHVITRAIGVGDDGSPDVSVECAIPSDRFLLCTDGLTDVVPDDRIRQVLSGLPPDFACAALVGEAMRRGSRDNVTTLVVTVH